MGTIPFVHLHAHTPYSILDGSNRIRDYLERVKELGMESAAITDHGVMYGAVEFYKTAKELGVHPVIGCEVYVAPGTMKEKPSSGTRYYHLVLLAENNTGYHNLLKLVSKGFLEGFYYRPRIDLKALEENHEGIIALSGCLAGEVAKKLSNGMYEGACEAAKTYSRIFGDNNFFLELQDHGIPEQKIVNDGLVRMSRELGLPLVATNDIHYTLASDADSHDILLCIQTGKKLSDKNRLRYEGRQYYVKSQEEMSQLFPYALEAVENTAAIARRCQVELTFGEYQLPQYDTLDGMEPFNYLKQLCNKGMEETYGEYRTRAMEERLDYELDVIKSMGFVDYFLIVWDFIHFAKEHGIAVGPGRGSAAGSIVSYCLGITDIDPIRYNLLFERFLNPERVTMPDIDIDFCYERRQEVIDYVVKKYGQERVVQIVTFGTLAAKGVVRDVGRVMDIPYTRCAAIAKMVPDELGITLIGALKQNKELQKVYQEDSEIKRLIDTAIRLEGLPRHTSVHAAGVVICPKAVSEYVPLALSSDGLITTQYIMTTLEELGLLKMDFLSLRTLTAIQNAVYKVKEDGKDLDMSKIDYGDQKVLDFIGTGRTDGIFQLESQGMKSFMAKLKPKSLEDVIAGISLYRPGPMDFIPNYISGKANPEAVKYACPQLEPILKSTYGCIIFQEQVMEIVRKLAGYSYGRSDLVRRAMAKKKAAVMEKERQVFLYGDLEENIPGCVKNGISEETANRIYDDMTDFAKYAFNKSHAAAYAVISYQTAYLMYHYPKEYMAALLSSVRLNPLKTAEYILLCRQMGVPVLQPNINIGSTGFTIQGESIVYCLSAIKGVGDLLLNAIIKERERKGAFKNIKDFLSRMYGGDGVSKGPLEALIKAGALDCLGGTRKQFLSVCDSLLSQIAYEKKNFISGQRSILQLCKKKKDELVLPDIGEYEKGELLAFEKEVLGVYISGHPLEAYQKQWEKSVTAKSSDFLADDQQEPLGDGALVTIGGMITDVKKITTKGKKIMACLEIEDLLGSVEVVVFPAQFDTYESIISNDQIVFVTGSVDREEDGESKLILKQMELLKLELWIQFEDISAFERSKEKLFKIITEHHGNQLVNLYLKSEKKYQQLPADKGIAVGEDVKKLLQTAFGSNNVKFSF